MAKEYSEWHARKTEIEAGVDARVFFHEREVWWCSVGSNVGFEQDGKGRQFARPVLVFKKFNKEIFWALPLTTRMKANKFYAAVQVGDGIDRAAIVSQLRLMDGKRLIDKLGVIGEANYAQIQKAVIKLCSL